MSGRLNRLYLWWEKALFLTERIEAAPHSHHVTEICLALDGTLDVETARGTALRNARGIVLGPHVEHRVIARGERIAVLLLGPMTPAGRSVVASLGGRQIMEVPGWLVDRAVESFAGLPQEQSLEGVHFSCRSLLEGLAPPRGLPPGCHPRIQRALRVVPSRLEEPVPTAAFARAVGLSSRRFGTLFRTQVGMPLRGYRRWLRLRLALAIAFTGESFTTAAHEAGFADSAHFCRTCHRTFGLAPSRIPRIDLFEEHVSARPPEEEGLRSVHPLPFG